jgi:nicotinamide riboside transporter PnuC
MYYIQIFLYSLLVVLGLILAVISPDHMTIGVIGSVAGITCLYLTIKEKRNQPRQW